MRIFGYLRCLAAVLALGLASCGGGGSSGGSTGTTPPPSSSPSPTPTPTPVALTPFSYAAPFAFESSLGIEGTLFNYQESFLNVQRTELVEPRPFPANSTARISLDRQGNDETIAFRYDDITISATRPAESSPEFRVVDPGGAQERLVIGPLSPGFLRGRSGGPTHVSMAIYRASPVARTIDTRVGTGQRIVYSIFGNPANEFGRLARSKEFDVGGASARGLSFGGFFIQSADYASPNGVFFGVLSVAAFGSDGQRTFEADLFIEGEHDIATNRLSGRFRDRQGGVVIGTFEGGLYGPQRNHVGLVYNLDLPRWGRDIGAAFGIGADRG
ncbi:hypothetical protein [Erythrobacter sp. CCH5-A1]|jgi:hypothetical protein|uniref:hypothetical protein n=1 Tax=Erythrobacter sp. CCH5-A1 TaxID=1768792 RepID=UPI00083185E6|nr:hypothetical protein [Erythrobacter sp. CCH5-A1]